MSARRSHSFAWRDFASNGISLTEKALEGRIQQFRIELLADIPAVRTLSASTLSFSFTPEANSFRIGADLEETAQAALRLSTRRDGLDDLFAQDVFRVQEDQARLREAYGWAFYSNINPSLDDRIIELRKRVSRDSRGGILHIHSGLGGEVFETGTIRKSLPLSRANSIKVKIVALSRTWVQVQLMEDLPGEDGMPSTYSAKTKLRVMRGKFKGDPETTGLLASAMDALSVVRLQVAIDLSWIDGSPYCVTLIELPNSGFS